VFRSCACAATDNANLDAREKSALRENVYDKPDFFAWFSRSRRSIAGLDASLEWPALRLLLPAMNGLRVLDLGCGFGWFGRWARARGAAQVVGLDSSEKMLARARADTSDVSIIYQSADLEELDLPEAQFDLAHSALALHYVKDLGRLFETIHGALIPGGSFVFSTVHAIYTAPKGQYWLTDFAGQKIWPLNNYFMEGPRTERWSFSDGSSGYQTDVVVQHRTVGTTLNLLIRAGFAIRRIEEFCPTAEQIAARPELADERERPKFLFVAAQK
jgi:SAM-dependent methyltransferase